MVPRWVLSVVALAAAVAAIDVAVFLVARDGTPTADAQSTSSADVVAVIDAQSRHVVDRIHVGYAPADVVAGYGGAWILNKGKGTLTHIDARTHHIVATVPLDVIASDLAVGAGGIWLTGRVRGDISSPPEYTKLERIDPEKDIVDRQLDSRSGAFVIAAGGNALWSTGVLPGHIRGAARSDAATGATRKVNIEIYGDLVAANDQAAYWVGSIASRVARVSLRTGLLTNSMSLATDASLAAGHVPPNPTGVTLGGGSLWISAVDGTVLRVDPHLREIVASIPACDNVLAIAYGEGAVWVACANATVVRIDPKTDQAGPPIAVGALPRSIAVGGGAVWVTLD